jgi:hypothetical protein
MSSPNRQDIVVIRGGVLSARERNGIDSISLNRDAIMDVIHTVAIVVSHARLKKSRKE